MQKWGPNGENLGSPTYKNARKLFNSNNNDISMATTGLYQQARINHDNPDFYNSDDWMVVPYPKFENAVKDVAACYYGHYYMVNDSENDATKKAAWQLIGYMLSHGEEYLTNVNIIQPTKALMNSDTYHNMPFSEVFTTDFERGHVVYFGANSTEIQNLIRNAVEGVMLQNVEPAQAYRQLKNSVQELIDEE
jgi:multiple sugar transport system substrate-binding protein